MSHEDMAERVRVRFAPSPTGSLHIGNAHTALFNWLFARHAGGSFVLRIEDTDVTRSTSESEWEIAEDLRWLGLDWDEGPDVGGAYGPYRQIERLSIYAEHAGRLERAGLAYRCYCTPEQLEQDKREALSEGKPPRYPGRCRELGAAGRARLEEAGRKAALRFRVDALTAAAAATATAGAAAATELVVDDLVRGAIRFDVRGLGDFVIIRSDGVPTYNFAVVVDDMLMDITHVLRADEHIANTPRQMLIYQALGHAPPRFAHVSMILGPDRTKLSKRHGATSVSAYRMEGYPPKALVNHLALLGWTPPAGFQAREMFEVDELVRLFSLEQAGRSPSVFDVAKLNWMSNRVIRAAPLDQVVSDAAPFLVRSGLVTPVDLEVPARREKVARAVEVMRGYVHRLCDLPDQCAFLLGRDVPEPDGAAREALAWEGARSALGAALDALGPGPDLDDPQAVHDMLLAIPDKLGQSRKGCLVAIRAALTGRTSGPELHLVAWALGREAAVKRLQAALAGRGWQRVAGAGTER